MRAPAATATTMGNIVRVLRQAQQSLPGSCFATKAPRCATYVGSQYWPLLRTIQDLNLPPDFSFADLGSGLGNIVFVAATHFKTAVGLELDPTLLNTALHCNQELGFENVTFRQEDFLQADLAPFDVIFFFKPFAKDFVALMSQKMKELRPGTTVIANTIPGECAQIFAPALFERIFSLEGKYPLRSEAERYATYLRRSRS